QISMVQGAPLLLQVSVPGSEDEVHGMLPQYPLKAFALPPLATPLQGFADVVSVMLTPHPCPASSTNPVAEPFCGELLTHESMMPTLSSDRATHPASGPASAPASVPPSPASVPM